MNIECKALFAVASFHN